MSNETTDIRDRCGVTDLLNARIERRGKLGHELHVEPSAWLSRIFSKSADISDAIGEHGEEDLLYRHVAELGAICLAWLQSQAQSANASEKQDEPAQVQSRDE